MRKNRLKRLADSIDALADKIKLSSPRRTKSPGCGGSRRQIYTTSAAALWTTSTGIFEDGSKLRPAGFTPESFSDEGLNLLQINARGPHSSN